MITALAGPLLKVALGGFKTCTWTANDWGVPVHTCGPGVLPDPATFVPEWFCRIVPVTENVPVQTTEPVTVAMVLLAVSVAFLFTPTKSTWALATLLVIVSAARTSNSLSITEFIRENIPSPLPIFVDGLGTGLAWY